MQPQHLKECHVTLKELIFLNARTKKRIFAQALLNLG